MECRRYRDEGVLCQDHCYFKNGGLKECPEKKYEEAAIAYVDNLGDAPPDHRDLRDAFVAGASFAEKEMKVDKALDILKIDLDGHHHEGVVPDRRVIQGTWAVPEEKHRAAMEAAGLRNKSEESCIILLQKIVAQLDRIEGSMKFEPKE